MTDYELTLIFLNQVCSTFTFTEFTYYDKTIEICVFNEDVEEIMRFRFNKELQCIYHNGGY